MVRQCTVGKYTRKLYNLVSSVDKTQLTTFVLKVTTDGVQISEIPPCHFVQISSHFNKTLCLC